ncbi:ribonuclease H-like domain-containing protein [Tanacetum coccineum]
MFLGVDSEGGIPHVPYRSSGLGQYSLPRAQTPCALRWHAACYAFHHSRCDSSLFIYKSGTNVAYLLLYVDDIILTASSTALLQYVVASLHQEFSMIDLGPLNYSLGFCCSYCCNDSKLGVDGDLVEDSAIYRSLASALQYLTFTCSAEICPGALLHNIIAQDMRERPLNESFEKKS